MKIELAHDFLAKKIYEEASIEDKTRAKATTFLQERYQYYLISNDLLLTAQDLLYIAPHVQTMDLSSEELAYVEHCKSIIKKIKFRTRLKDAALVASICMVVFSSWGFWEHNRFQHTSEELANAKDTISVLRNMENPIYEEEEVQVAENSFLPVDAASAVFYSTIKLTGTVNNEQKKVIESATISLLGAEVLSNKEGAFELYLVLSPKDLSQELELKITKANYITFSQPIDSDLSEMNFDLVLIRE